MPYGLDQVRQTILDAADKLFARRPVREIELDEVCAAANVSVAVFTQRFPTMDELHRTLVSRRHNRCMLDLVRAPSWTEASAPDEQLLAFFDVFDDWIVLGRLDDTAAPARIAPDTGPQDAPANAGLGHLASVRAVIADVARQSQVSDPDAFARDWHILIKGALAAAADGDAHAFRRARAMAERLLATGTSASTSHSPNEERLAELTRMALYDPLTGLANRTLLKTRFQQRRADLADRGGVLAGLLIDIDDFKKVNDRYGHDTGDHVLQTAAQEMLNVVRRADTVARVGGDEFVILAHVADQPEAEALRTRLGKRLKTDIETHGHRIGLRATVGMATTQDPSITRRTLIARADRDMYERKRQRSGSS